MVKKTEKDSWKNQAIAIFFVFLMLGSTVTYAVISIFKPAQTSFIPPDRILNYKLTEEQINFLVQNYQTIIEYDYPANCIDCLEVKNILEELTQNSENQIFLQEIIVNESKANLYVVNILNETSIEEPTPSIAASTVCNALISAPTWCVLNQV